MSGKYYWIKERINPQLGTYYVVCGNLTTKKARSIENSLYGDNIMHKFATEKEYNAEIERLKSAGKSVQ